MFETVTSMIGLPGAVLAVWVTLIAALFLVSRGLSRALAWTFVVAGLAVPVAVLQIFPLTSPDACVENVLQDGDTADGRYAYRILESQCRGSSEYAYRVEMGRRDPVTAKADMRPVMRSYGFPRPVAVRQIAGHHFLIFLTSNGRDQVPLRISLHPETGEPSYVHRFFQGHSDRSFTVSELSHETAASESASGQRKAGKDDKPCDKERRRSTDMDTTARVTAPPHVSRRGSESGLFNFKLALRGLM